MVGIYSSNPAWGHSNKHPQAFTTDYTFSPVVAVIYLFPWPPKSSTSWWTICAVRVVTKGLMLKMNADWHQCQSAFTSVWSSALHFGFNNPKSPVRNEAVLSCVLRLMISSVFDHWNTQAPLSRASHRTDYDNNKSICPSRNKVTQVQNNRLPLRDLPNAGNPI